jgi:hypothetical protein
MRWVTGNMNLQNGITQHAAVQSLPVGCFNLDTAQYVLRAALATI